MTERRRASSCHQRSQNHSLLTTLHSTQHLGLPLKQCHRASSPVQAAGGLTVSVRKTKSMAVGESADRRDVVVGVDTIEVVTNSPTSTLAVCSPRMVWPVLMSALALRKPQLCSEPSNSRFFTTRPCRFAARGVCMRLSSSWPSCKVRRRGPQRQATSRSSTRSSISVFGPSWVLAVVNSGMTGSQRPH